MDKVPFPVSTSYIYICLFISLSMYFEVINYRWVLSDNGCERTYILYFKCENLHICIFDILPMWYNLLSVGFGPSWLSIFQLKVKLGRSKPKCYCKSNDSPRCLFLLQEHYPPSAFAREPPIIHTCNLHSQIFPEVEQWPQLMGVTFSQTLKLKPVLPSIFCNVHHNEDNI